ncbi:MAG: transposase [Saprospiraceae bacterium]|nr:transposase [Saprospiraceae bacterium]
MGSICRKTFWISQVKWWNIRGDIRMKIAISNHRVLAIDDQTVTILIQGTIGQKVKRKRMTLSHEEFVHRFASHILPKRFFKKGLGTTVSWKLEKKKKKKKTWKATQVDRLTIQTDRG